MNPLTKVKLINELNEREASLGVKDSVSWHSEYKDSAWVFIGGFPYELSEGDIICVFSQYGEIVNINLVRDKKTGKSKGFCFLCYEDQRSTILSVDNLNGIKIKGRTIRVDHVANYRPPKDHEDIDDITKTLRERGCAPKPPSSSSESEEEDGCVVPMKKSKKEKKEKKKKKKEKKEKKKEKKEEAAASHAAEDRRADQRQQHQSSPSPSPPPAPVKREKVDEAYDKYAKKGPSDTRLPRGERLEAGGSQRDRERQEDGPSRAWHLSDRDREQERDRDREPRIKEEDRRKDWSREGRATSPRDKNRQRMEREDNKATHQDSHPRDSWDRPKERDRERDRDQDRSRERDREKERDKERDRDRERERERDRERDRDRDRERERDRERDRDRGRDKERDRDRDRKYR